MLGGLAAGLGLAWLAHSLGLGAAFGKILLIAPAGAGGRGGVAHLRGAFARGTALQRSRRLRLPGRGRVRPIAAAPVQYSPNNVGNDASARPWERNSAAFDATPAEHRTAARRWPARQRPAAA